MSRSFLRLWPEEAMRFMFLPAGEISSPTIRSMASITREWMLDSSGDILAQMDRMCDAIYDRFGAVQELFGHFDIVHGHDWHPVLALSHKAGLRPALYSDHAQHGMGQKRQ